MLLYEPEGCVFMVCGESLRGTASTLTKQTHTHIRKPRTVVCLTGCVHDRNPIHKVHRYRVHLVRHAHPTTTTAISVPSVYHHASSLTQATFCDAGSSS